MEKSFERKRDRDNLWQDSERAGEHMLTALREVSADVCGEELAVRIVDKASMPDSTWPNPDILELLNGFYPGFAERVMSRAEAIQKEIHERDLA